MGPSTFILIALASAPKVARGHQDENAPASQPLATLALDASLVLNVSDARGAADQLVSKVEALGGYFSQRDDQSLVLKVPKGELDQLLGFAETLGTVLERTHQAQDLRIQLEQQRTRAASKRKMLEQYLAVLEDATAQAIGTVEQQVTSLVSEIEQLRGSIRLLEHQLQMASLRVAFRLRQRQTPMPDGMSPFPWLNTLDLVDLYRDFTDEE